MGEKRVTQQVASDEIYNDDWFLKDSVLHDTTKVQPSVIKEYVNQGMATSQDLADEATARQNMDSQLASGIGQQMSNLADFYDTTKSYVVGDVCVLQSGELMRCIAPTSGAFDNTKWEQVTVDELFDDLNFSADAISYDNTSSGLEADNVQDAIGETITKLSAVGTASGAIATFPDGSDLPMPKLEVAIEPQQDLHGYDAPWVGGAGKNKLEVNATSNTVNGVTFTVNSDGTIKANGTATANADLWLHNSYGSTDAFVGVGDYIVNCVGSKSGVQLQIGYAQSVYRIIESESDVSISATNNGISWVLLRVSQGTSVNNTLIKPMIRLATVSDATFAPYSNICPIIGWDEVNVGVSGVNVWDEEWEVGNINDGSGEDLPQDNVIRSKGYISVMSGENYYIKCPTTGISRLFLYAEDKSFITYVPIDNITDNIYTIPNNCAFIRFRTLAAYGTTYKNDISINYPSTATSYHAYNGHTYTLDLDGTRYGGKVDLVSGVMTVKMAMVDLGTLTWIYNTSSSLNPFFYAPINGIKSYGAPYNVAINALSSLYKIVRRTEADFVDGCLCGDGTATTILQIQVKDSKFTDATAFKTAMNGVQLVYELATPLTIQLTPTVVKSLRGVNNVFADSGAILDAEYIRDLTTIIDYILEQLNA